MIRRALGEDAEAVADVFIPSFRGLTFLPKLHSDDKAREWIRTVVIPDHEVWLVEEDGRVVGFAAFSEEMLDHLYVHPDAQSRGLGTVLFNRARKRRPEGFRFWVFQKNEGARRFYERHGCRVVELTDGSGNEHGEPDALYEWAPRGVNP